MRKRYAIGIDPGKKTGVAWYDREKRKIATYETSDFWSVYHRFADETAWSQNVEFVIEVRQGHVIDGRKDGEASAFGRDKFAANVGGNRREAELLADGLESCGYDVRRVNPTRTKWTAKDLKQRTGIAERTNEHVRDAIALVYGL